MSPSVMAPGPTYLSAHIAVAIDVQMTCVRAKLSAEDE